MTRLQPNGTLWLDTDGNPIHAHGGHMLQHDGWYYWYGEDRRDNIYVSVYRSKNLVDWEFRRHVLWAAQYAKHKPGRNARIG